MLTSSHADLHVIIFDEIDAICKVRYETACFLICLT